MTSEPVVEATAPPKHQFGPVVAVVVLVGLAGMLFLFSLRSWAVNFDGTSYLALAANLRELNGYVAPDGSAMTIRGPGYPMLLALGWLFEGFPSGLAMAASRIGIVVGGVGAALITLRIGRSGAAAVVGGLLALASLILLPSGAVGFAPDGLAATVAVVAVLLLVARPASPWAVVSAGLLTGLAYVTKEGHALVMVGALLWGIIAAAETRRASRFVVQFGTGAAAIILPWDET